MSFILLLSDGSDHTREGDFFIEKIFDANVAKFFFFRKTFVKFISYFFIRRIGEDRDTFY